jgi:hypothetical protein
MKGLRTGGVLHLDYQALSQRIMQELYCDKYKQRCHVGVCHVTVRAYQAMGNCAFTLKLQPITPPKGGYAQVSALVQPCACCRSMYTTSLHV